jgi:hypothetical protein
MYGAMDGAVFWRKNLYTENIYRLKEKGAWIILEGRVSG